MSVVQAALDRAKKQRESALQAAQRTDAAAASKDAPSAAAAAGAIADRSAAPLAPGEAIDLAHVRKVAANPVAMTYNRVLTPVATEPGAQSAYSMLRTRVMQRMRPNGWRTLGMFAAGADEGKTLTAINLAISIAAEVGQQVVLVDLDLRRPTVYKYLGVAERDFIGLADYLDGRCDNIRELFVCPQIEGLTCILNATPMDRSSDALASPRARKMIEDVRRLTPGAIVLFDLPPLLVTDDALVVAPLLDATLLIAAEGRTKRAELIAAKQILREFPVIGTLLNMSAERERRYAHY